MGSGYIQSQIYCKDKRSSGFWDISRLGPESPFCESFSDPGEIQFTSLYLPWDYLQGTGSVLDYDRLTSLELFFSPICKGQMNMRIHRLTGRAVQLSRAL